MGSSVASRERFIARIEAIAGPVAGRLVVDLGCGAEALWTRAYAARGATVLAVDLDHQRCRAALEGLRAAGFGPPGRIVGVVRGDGGCLPLAEASVGFLHCAQVLEHVDDPARVVAEVRRVLAPGAHAYLTAINRLALRDPHFGVLGVNYLPRDLADRLLAWLEARNPEGQPLSAMHYFTPRSLRRLCISGGLEVVDDLKHRQRLERHGALGARVADLWGMAVRSSAFHWLVRRPPEAAHR